MAEKKSAAKPATSKPTGKQAAPPRDPQTLSLPGKQGESMSQTKARATTKASINAVLVVNAFQGNIMGKDVDMGELVTTMQTKFTEVNDGDLTSMEAMLVGQATALQTIFTSLAMRAASQEYLKNYQSFMALALKAQAQSRATISALVDLKYPRQSTFVKQANISNGPQQVNNGDTQNTGTHAGRHSQAEKTATLQNELLEDQRHGSTNLGTRATTKAARSHSAVEAVGTVNRPANRHG